MPTYDYKCGACGHLFEHFQSISDARLKKCPKCGKPKLERLIGAGGGLLFKGSGFYITDYRNSAYRDAAKNDAAKPAPETKSSDAKSSEAKSPEAKAPAPKESGEKSPAPAAAKPAAPAPAAPSGSKKRR
jgi:putative FmdB family regulatory protein